MKRVCQQFSENRSRTGRGLFNIDPRLERFGGSFPSQVEALPSTIWSTLAVGRSRRIGRTVFLVFEIVM